MDKDDLDDLMEAYLESRSRKSPKLTVRDVVHTEIRRMRQSFEAIKQDPAYASSIPYCDTAIELLPHVEETYAYWLEDATFGDRGNQQGVPGGFAPIDPEARKWLRDPMALQKRIKASQQKVGEELRRLEIPSDIDDAQAQTLYDTFATVEYATMAKKVAAFALRNLTEMEAKFPREK